MYTAQPHSEGEPPQTIDNTLIDNECEVAYNTDTRLIMITLYWSDGR